MDNKDIKVLGKIREHAASIVTETSGIGDAETFKNTNDKSKAALFDLLQIGELSKDGLSQDAVNQMQNIPWREIYALRCRIVHGYASVDYEIIWETIQGDIPRLISDIDKVLNLYNM